MGSSANLFPRLFPSSFRDDQNKVGAPDGTEQNLGEPVDLSVSPVMEASTAPVIKLSFKEIVSSVQKQNKATKNIDGIAGTAEQPTPPRLIALSTLGNKNEHTIGKRTRSLGPAANEPAQKKSSQNSLASSLERSPLLIEQPRPRNQDREEEIEEEVKRSCQNIQWTREPLPKNIDHWFHDLEMPAPCHQRVLLQLQGLWCSDGKVLPGTVTIH